MVSRILPVIVVWFDKKKGRPFAPVLPSPICGPKAGLLAEALGIIDVPCYQIPAEDLLYELVRKNRYILVVNIVGITLRPGGTISELWNQHRELAERVIAEILDIQEWLCRQKLPRERLIAGMLAGFEGDPNHVCMGRSARERLRRALRYAEEAGIPTPTLQAIAKA